MKRACFVAIVAVSVSCRGCTSRIPAAPTTTVVAPSIACPQSLALDATDVYWVGDDHGGLAVFAVPKTGGAPRVLVPFAASTLNGGLVVTKDAVYWARERIGSPGRPGDIDRIDKAGKGSLGLLVTGETTPHALGADGDHLYFLTNDSVKRVPLTGGAVETIASGQRQPTALAVDGGEVFWLTSSRFDLAALDTQLKKAPVTGGPVVSLAVIDADLSNIAVDGSSILVETDVGHAEMSGKRAIQSVARTGGPPTEVIERLSESTALLAGSGSVYYTTTDYPGSGTFARARGTLLRVATTGGTPVVAAAAAKGEQLRAVAMDATDLYFAESVSDHCALRKVVR